MVLQQTYRHAMGTITTGGKQTNKQVVQHTTTPQGPSVLSAAHDTHNTLQQHTLNTAQNYRAHTTANSARVTSGCRELHSQIHFLKKYTVCCLTANHYLQYTQGLRVVKHILRAAHSQTQLRNTTN
ncbi:hypothetical protein E2C01_030680 [Portunus trituberculatus]|uniref:Uncharacterized protein n=1 Tax=Portunus trituberculatus TaxID=210409 RepID=A0A5B7EVI7_PORTR|nr:hypothetical protein [Portunus trituberculatus]